MSARYTIRVVTPNDLEAFWQLRLLALRDAPDAFGADYETSQQHGPAYAERGFFANGVPSLFGAYTSEGEVVAQSATFAETGKRSHIAHIVSVYTHPDHRGNGLGTRVVEAARDHLLTFSEITSIRISVNANNVAAIAIYERLGFVTWGEEPDAIRTKDGSCHNERHMVLASGARRS